MNRIVTPHRVRQDLLRTLPPFVTLNGVTVPLYSWSARPATATTIPGRSADGSLISLAAGGGAAPTLLVDVSKLIGLTNATRWWAAPTAGDFQLATEDVYCEGINLTHAAATSVAGQLDLSPSVIGWEVQTTGTNNRMRLTVYAGGVGAPVDSGDLSAATLIYWSAAIDRNLASTSGGQFYVSGAASGSGVDCSAHAADVSNDQKFTIGARAGGTSPYASTWVYFAIGKRDAWLNGQTDVLAAHIARAKHLGFA